jgi:hypothetical protein
VTVYAFNIRTTTDQLIYAEATSVAQAEAAVRQWAAGQRGLDDDLVISDAHDGGITVRRVPCEDERQL